MCPHCQAVVFAPIHNKVVILIVLGIMLIDGISTAQHIPSINQVFPLVWNTFCLDNALRSILDFLMDILKIVLKDFDFFFDKSLVFFFGHSRHRATSVLGVVVSYA